MGRKNLRDSTPPGHVDKKIKKAMTSGDDDTDHTTPSPSSSRYNPSGLENDPRTPSNAIRPVIFDSQQTPLSESSSKGQIGQMLEAGSGVAVDLDVRKGEYVLKIKRRSNPSSTYEHKVEEAKQMAQSAGMLFLQAEILRDMGEHLLAQSRASLQDVFRNPAPQNP